MDVPLQAVDGGENDTLLYRITGPQSIERLNPLLQLISKPHDSAAPVQWRWAEDSDTQLSFVWETACEKAWRDRHLQAGVLNRLNNSQVLEDKSNLAYLQLNMTVPVLETFIARCPDDFRRWADNRWSPEEPGATDISDSLDWWAVKAARGNGGKDVWITNRDNYADTFAQLPRQGELVIQKYVDRPLLWKGKKFHLRCYSMIMADLTALVYEKCYILTAGKDYQTDTADISSHITNLSVNKHIPGYPGQVPCDLPTEFPEAFENVCKLWESVVSAASDFMKEQQNENNFEFYGIDIIVDVDHKCWLIEINRLPGLESSNLNKDAEDSFYNEMMLSVLQMVTKPLLSRSNGSVKTVSDEVKSKSAPEVGTDSKVCGRWRTVGSSGQAYVSSSLTWKNLFKWKIFTTKNRSKLFVS